jgi:hypothetical protein
MKILMFMCDNRILKEDYYTLATAINSEYCKKYNYDFIYYRPFLKDNSVFNCKNPITGKLRHAAWSKLLATQKALKLDYDYVVYIDTDCIIKDFDKRLETLACDKIIFLSNKPWGEDLPCSGFFMVPVNDYYRDFFTSWYNVDIPNKDINHPWEQDALWKIYNNYKFKIVNEWSFKEYTGQFIRHVCHCESKNRLPYFQEFAAKKNIVVDLDKIVIIEFCTQSE